MQSEYLINEVYQSGRSHNFINRDFPTILSPYFFPIFLRGYFEVNGSITKRNPMMEHHALTVTMNLLNDSKKKNFLLSQDWFIKPDDEEIEDHQTTFYYFDINAIEFLYLLYKDLTPSSRCDYLYSTYVDWVTQPYSSIPVVKFSISGDIDGAVIPTKHRITDVGYDLTIVKKVKSYGSLTTMYDTGVKIRPSIGFYTKIVPRSSLIKSGYILTNSVGIIDTGFSDTLKICLTKIDPTLPDLTLPFKCCQLILEKLNHYEFKQDDDEFQIKTTTRGTGGFGSTELKK